MSLPMNRTSIRRYTSEPVQDEYITRMLKAAMQAPSANNQQPWEFIVVQDRATLNHLSQASRGAWMLAEAPLAIIVVMKDEGRSPGMKPQDCAAATQNILLEAVECGLGAVWIGVHPLSERETYVNNTLNITRGTAFCQIAIGHPAEEKTIQERYDASRVHREKME